jgi:choline dehydrogenase-like flavoprotein
MVAPHVFMRHPACEAARLELTSRCRLYYYHWLWPRVALTPARTDGMVYEVVLNERGKASGVHYIDKLTNTRLRVRSRAVVLAASAGETARILLNSKSASFPDGVANSSGQVGRNLADTVATLGTGSIPALQGLPPFNDDGVSVPHAYVLWWGSSRAIGWTVAFCNGLPRDHQWGTNSTGCSAVHRGPQ